VGEGEGLGACEGEVDAGGGFDQLAVVGDAQVGANGGDDGVAVDRGIFGALDDALEGGADVVSAKLDEADGASVAEDRGSVVDLIVDGDLDGAAPVEEVVFDGLAGGVAADLAHALMAREAGSRKGSGGEGSVRGLESRRFGSVLPFAVRGLVDRLGWSRPEGSGFGRLLRVLAVTQFLFYPPDGFGEG
jgi:hypothetical protein